MIMGWQSWRLKSIENNTWARVDMEFPFECSTRYLMRREIPYLQATMYYFVYYINTLEKIRKKKTTLFTNNKQIGTLRQQNPKLRLNKV